MMSTTRRGFLRGDGHGATLANGGDELAQLVVPGVSVRNQQHPWPVSVGDADVIGGFAEVDHPLPADDGAARLGITVEAAAVGDGGQATVPGSAG